MTNGGEVGVEDYDVFEARQFVADAHEQELTPRHYMGSWGWEGPAVCVEELSDFHASVPTQFETVEVGYLVFPKVSAKRRTG